MGGRSDPRWLAGEAISRRALLRRALALGGAATLAPLLAACGFGSGAALATAVPLAPATPGTPAGAATPATSTATATPRPGPATPVATPASATGRNGVTDSEVRLGTWGPQDGPAGVYGVVSRAIAAYFKRVNAEGGIAGRAVALINENDSYLPTRTATVVRKLVEEDRVFALVGGLGIQPNLQVLDYLVRSDVPYVAPATGSGLLSRPTRPRIFCVQPSYAIEATLLARHALDALGARRPAIFFQDEEAGREGRDAVQAELRRRGLAAATEVAAVATDRNYSAQALRVAASGADAVIVYAVPQVGGGFLQELAKAGGKPRVLASSLIDDPAFFGLAGAASDGVILAAWLPDTNDTANEKVAAFRAWLAANLPGEAAIDFAAIGYAYATLMAELLRRTGRELTRERFVAAADALRGYTGSLLPAISYAPDDHQGSKSLYFRRANFADKSFTRLTDYIEYK